MIPTFLTCSPTGWNTTCTHKSPFAILGGTRQVWVKGWKSFWPKKIAPGCAQGTEVSVGGGGHHHLRESREPRRGVGSRRGASPECCAGGPFTWRGRWHLPYCGLGKHALPSIAYSIHPDEWHVKRGPLPTSHWGMSQNTKSDTTRVCNLRGGGGPPFRQPESGHRSGRTRHTSLHLKRDLVFICITVTRKISGRNRENSKVTTTCRR
mgnify:CR=1 FL=1